MRLAFKVLHYELYVMGHFMRMRQVILLLTLLTIMVIKNAGGQNFDYKNYLLEQQLPSWFLDLYHSEKIDSSYKIADYINPFYIEADFNSDGKIDIAVLIEENKTKKKGIIICHGQTKTFFIIGAGKQFGNGGDDFSWMNIWKVYRNAKLEPGVGETEIINLRGHAIWVEKSEAASAVIYWTGKNYKWYQQGD